MNTLKYLLIFFMCLQAKQTLASFESSLFTRQYETYSSMEDAKKAAGSGNKGIFVYFTRTKCPPCDDLRISVLSKSEIAPLISSGFVFTAVWGSSMGQAERQSYREKYGEFGAPTFILFNSRGEYICTSRGGFFKRIDDLFCLVWCKRKERTANAGLNSAADLVFNRAIHH